MSRFLHCIRSGVILWGLMTLQFPSFVLAQSEWMQFRGPGGRGISNDRGLPTTWSQQQNIAWKTPLPGAGTSAPIVVGSKVYLTSYTGYSVPGEPMGSMEDLKRQVHCLDFKTGKVLWTREVPSPLPDQARIRENHGYASNTPVSDGQRLYVFFGKAGVFAFDLDGQKLWHASVGSNLNGWGSAASPILYKNLVIVNASVESESIVALDQRTGKEVWRSPGIRESWNTPILVDVAGGKQELVVAILGKVFGIDPDTGNRLWNCATDISWYMVPTLVEQDQVIYCIGGRTGGALAVRAGGQGDVTKSHRLWVGKKGSNVPSPIVKAGYLYWAHENLGVVYCAEIKTGRIVYEERLDRAGQIYGSPVMGDGKLYYVTREGRTYVLAVGPRFQVLAVNDLSDRSPFNSTPAIAGGKILLRSDKFLYCIGAI